MLRPIRHLSLVPLLLGSALLSPLGSSAASNRSTDCDAPVWGKTVTVFDARVKAYVGVRNGLDSGVPLTAVERRALAARIRKARPARISNLFTPELAVEVRKSLRREIDTHTWKAIMDDNPGELPSQVYDEYRDGQTLSTMPPNVLGALPRIPDGLEYRFVQRHLILLDTRARLIVDRIPYAIVDPTGKPACQ